MSSLYRIEAELKLRDVDEIGPLIEQLEELMPDARTESLRDAAVPGVIAFAIRGEEDCNGTEQDAIDEALFALSRYLVEPCFIMTGVDGEVSKLYLGDNKLRAATESRYAKDAIVKILDETKRTREDLLAVARLSIDKVCASFSSWSVT